MPDLFPIQHRERGELGLLRPVFIDQERAENKFWQGPFIYIGEGVAGVDEVGFMACFAKAILLHASIMAGIFF